MLEVTPISKYTIIIAKQKGEYFIYPGSTSSWILKLGDKIHFINTTEDAGTLNVKTEGYFDDTSFGIDPNQTVIKDVLDMKSAEGPLEFTFTIPIPGGGGDFLVNGGPKMVPTDPQF